MTPPVVEAIVLAAGTSRRMGSANKLLATRADGCSLIAITVANASASAVRAVHVVLGHDAGAVRRAIGPGRASLLLCPDHAQGLSHSLQAGLRALGQDADAVLVCLGDMPLVTPALIDGMIARWQPGTVLAPCHGGRRGNPVLWDRSFVPRIAAAQGDRGAGWLLPGLGAALHSFAAPDDAIMRDADHPAALRALPGGPWRAADGTPI